MRDVAKGVGIFLCVMLACVCVILTISGAIWLVDLFGMCGPSGCWDETTVTITTTTP